MRLLFITSTRIGDAVLSTGLLRHLIERHPGARVTAAAGLLAAPLFESVPGLERVLVMDKRPLSLHWLSLWAAAAPRRWDMVVDLRASAIAYLLAARRRAVIGKRADARHRVEELGDLLGLAAPPEPTVWLSPAHEAAAETLIPPGGPVLAVGPAANWIGKQWRAERFAELVLRLTAPEGPLPGARVAVSAAGHERAQAQPVLDALPAERAIDLVGGVELPIVAACLRRCALFVGNDSGLMHLAAAAGAPTLGLFGPSPDSRYRPWGPKAAFVRTPQSYEELLPRKKDAPQVTQTLMDGLSVDTVFEAAEALYRKARKQS
jgi:ADP-heptose:LPS heptosyltransferase